MKAVVAACAVLLAAFGSAAAQAPTPAPAPATSPADPAAVYARLDTLFKGFAEQQKAPGMVWAVVAGGRLVHVGTTGVQDVETRTPVTADTVFRIASMTKNFTALAALKLRDEGRLTFDAPVSALVPELRGLKGPTSDSPPIRLRDLLGHTEGFVTDDPWGDRQLDMSEAEFSAFLRAGFPVSRTPGVAFEYSNTGFAITGRAVQNAAKRTYRQYLEADILRPLGMAASTLELAEVPAARRAKGYRREDDRWLEEPSLGHGAFGAMGGLHTTANDYAKYVSFVLDAWPARDGPEGGPVRRASVREIAVGNSVLRVNRRPAAERSDPAGCDTASVYGMGMIVLNDCRIGLALTHSGGLPGYGSNVIMLPERGVGVFAFSNLTYAPAAVPVREAAQQLVASGLFPVRVAPVSPGVQQMTKAAAAIYAAGDVNAAPEALAENLLLDRSAARRNAELATLKAALGACTQEEANEPLSAMQSQVIWRCERGRLRARLLLAPTLKPSLQSLEYTRLE